MTHQFGGPYVVEALDAIGDECAAIFDLPGGGRAVATPGGFAPIDPVLGLAEGEEYMLEPALPALFRRQAGELVVMAPDSEAVLAPGERPEAAVRGLLRALGYRLLTEAELMPPPGRGIRRDRWGRWWDDDAVLPRAADLAWGDIIGLKYPGGEPVIFAAEGWDAEDVRVYIRRGRTIIAHIITYNGVYDTFAGLEAGREEN